MTTARRHTTRDVLLWLGIYIAAVTLPLFALLAGSMDAGRGWAWDFAMALGYAGLAMLCVQFALTARFKRATAPFGIDIVYYFHRYLALLALALVLAHDLILRWHTLRRPTMHAWWLAGVGNPATPLDGIGSRLDAAALRDWTLGTGVAAEQLLRGIVRIKARATEDADMDVLIEYLARSR